jgi:peptidoglycan/LPS O-acetylase OafA/YrhL
MQAKRIQELDALRLFAASAVVLYHLTNNKLVSFPQIDWLTRFGYLGVELFFMISGFVILWSATGRTAWQFVVSRVARLYPIYWIAMLITTVFVPVTAIQLLANTTMFAGAFGQPFIDGVYWTLQIELRFYLIVGALLLFRQGSRLEGWLAIWLAASVAAEFIPILRAIVIYPYSPLFIGGAVCFLIRSNGLTVARSIMLSLSFMLAMSHSAAQSKGFVSEPGIVPELASTAMFAVMLAVALNRLPLRCAPAAAAITYPLYLVHNTIGKAVLSSIDSDLPAIGVSLAAVLSLAYVLSLLDKPLGNCVKLVAERIKAWAV